VFIYVTYVYIYLYILYEQFFTGNKRNGCRRLRDQSGFCRKQEPRRIRSRKRILLFRRNYNRYDGVCNGIMLAPRAVSVHMHSQPLMHARRRRLSPGRVPIALRALVARKLCLALRQTHKRTPQNATHWRS